MLPTRSAPDSIISPEERQALGGALSRQSDDDADQHRMLLAALAGATERCMLVLPRGDLRQSSEHVPSRWLAAAAGSLADRGERAYFSNGYLDADTLRAAALDPEVEDITEVPSYLAGVREASFPATETEYDAALLLRAAASGTTAGPALAAHAAPLRDPDFRAAVEMARGRDSPQFTRFDGNLSSVIDSAGAPEAEPNGKAVARAARERSEQQRETTGDATGRLAEPRALLADTVSATRLETWAGCPRKYLFEHMLGVRAVEDPRKSCAWGRSNAVSSCTRPSTGS